MTVSEQEVGVKGSLDSKFWSDEPPERSSKRKLKILEREGSIAHLFPSLVGSLLGISQYPNPEDATPLYGDTPDLSGFPVNSPTADLNLPITAGRSSIGSDSAHLIMMRSPAARIASGNYPLPYSSMDIQNSPSPIDVLQKLHLKQEVGDFLLDTAGQEDWGGEGADALSQETAERANQQKLHLKQEVQELLDTAGQEDWDGEGADALAPETVERAKALVDDFPQFVSRISDPDVSASPRGEIDFDWTLARNVMLTISVCPSGEIAFASTDNGTRLSGKGLWARDSLRNSVLACLRELCHESAAATYT